MGYLCCKGDFSHVLGFLVQQTKEIQLRYLNEKFHQFGGETIIHMLLMWNSSADDTIFTPYDDSNPYVGYVTIRSFDMYKALQKMGANEHCITKLSSGKLNQYKRNFMIGLIGHPKHATGTGNLIHVHVDYMVIIQTLLVIVIFD